MKKGDIVVVTGWAMTKFPAILECSHRVKGAGIVRRVKNKYGISTFHQTDNVRLATHREILEFIINRL